MNDTLDYKISVMQAAREGRQIEALNRHEYGAKWILTSGVLWNWADKTYRVKPQEPRRAFISTGDYDAYFFAYNPKTEIHKIESIQSQNPKCLVEFIELTPEIKQKLGL